VADENLNESTAGEFKFVTGEGDTYGSISEAAVDQDPDGNQVNPGEGQRMPSPIPCRGGTVYIIRRGDTLFGLAARFNTTVQAILQANPGLDPNRLFVGQRICIPVPQPPPCLGFEYTIVAGDNLFQIAARFNTTVEAILRANPGLNPNQLFIGQQICIPVQRPPVCPGFIYTIAAGDNLFSLANRFNTTVQAILQANPGLDPNRLFVGQQICIPVPQPPACPGFMYTIAAGDTLNSLANRFNTTVQAILQANPGLNPNVIFIGQQICIPVPQPPTCSGFFYVVVAGDNLFNLARRFNTSVEAIIGANPGVNFNRLMIGERICIPVQPR
jgi:peptidoglycan DL-endopeptidase LytF